LAVLYSIGHSTRSLEELIEVLQSHGIAIVADIRAFPRSRRLPHFNREQLETSLRGAEIGYIWLPKLGGRRKKIPEDSPHLALRSPSFRNYADYMLTEEFKQGVTELLKFSQHSRIAYMCAERVYFRCHRLLLSDWLVAHGHEVCHIDGTAPPKPHKLTPEARLVEGQLIYRGDRLL
jgi:uncharacterized protein (DUF488 family)